MKNSVLLGLLLIHLPSLLLANESLCGNKSGIERRTCLEGMLQVEEEKLNKAYDAAYAHIQKQEYIPPKGREEWKRDLDKARYNWVSFRDAECGVILYQWWGSMGGGPGNAILACEVQMTIDRQSVIEKFVSK